MDPHASVNRSVGWAYIKRLTPVTFSILPTLIVSDHSFKDRANPYDQRYKDRLHSSAAHNIMDTLGTAS